MIERDDWVLTSANPEGRGTWACTWCGWTVCGGGEPVVHDCPKRPAPDRPTDNDGG